MKPSVLGREIMDAALPLYESYPYEEYIINITSSTTSNKELVSWQFPNGEIVQLIFYSPDDAEIFSVSPAIVLPEEGDEGIFYTRDEIKLFLNKIQNAA